MFKPPLTLPVTLNNFNQDLRVKALDGENSDHFIEFIKKAKAQEISQAILAQPDQKDQKNIIQVVIAHQPLKGLRAILDKLKLNNLPTLDKLVLQKKNKDLLYHLASDKQTREEAFQILADHLGPKALAEAVLFQGSNAMTTLYWLAYHDKSQSLIKVLQMLPQTVIEQVVRQQTDDQYNLLYFIAASNMDNTALELLLKTLSQKVLRPAVLQIDNIQHRNVLHTLAFMGKDQLLIQVMNKLDSKTLQQAMLHQDAEKMNFLHIMAEKTPCDTLFWLMILALDKKILQQIILQRTFRKRNVLHIMIREAPNNPALPLLLGELSQRILDQAALQQDMNNFTPLHYLAEKTKGEALITMSKRLTPTVLAKAILILTNNQGNVLFWASMRLSLNPFMKFIALLSTETLTKALQQPCIELDKQHILHILVQRYKEQLVQFVINRLSPTVLGKLTLQKNCFGNNILQALAINEKNATLINIVKRLPVTILEQALLQLSHRQKSVLYWAGNKMHDTQFMTLIDEIRIKTGYNTLQKAILQKNRNDKNILHHLITWSTSKFMRTVKQLPTDIRHSALLQQDHDRNNVLFSCAYRLNSQTFIDFIHILDTKTVSEAVLQDNNDLSHRFNRGMFRKNASTLKAALRKLNEPAFVKAWLQLTNDEYTPRWGLEACAAEMGARLLGKTLNLDLVELSAKKWINSFCIRFKEDFTEGLLYYYAMSSGKIHSGGLKKQCETNENVARILNYHRKPWGCMTSFWGNGNAKGQWERISSVKKKTDALHEVFENKAGEDVVNLINQYAVGLELTL